MIINNNAYWNKYYKTSKLIHSPSNFAKYIIGSEVINIT